MHNVRMLQFKIFFRFLKGLYYKCLGLLGQAGFSFLRLIGLIPKIEAFVKQDVKKILVIRMDRIGDVVLSTPALRAIRNNFPQAQIYCLLRSYTKDLIEGNPNKIQVLVFDDNSPFLREVLRQAGELRKYSFDLAIVLHPNFWVNFLSFASGAKYRVGYDSAGSGFFLTTLIKDTRRINPRHEVEVDLDVLRSIGIDTQDKALEISLNAQAEKFVDEFLKTKAVNNSDTLIAMHPGGFYRYTHWLPEGFAAVGDSLVDRFNSKIIILGNPREVKLANHIAGQMKHKPIIAAGILNISQLVAMIKRCALFIGNSSGPMHIACALKVPVVAIFGNVHPVDNYKSWGPWQEKAIVVSKNLGCRNCQPADCLSLDCMKSVTAEEVLQAAQSLLERK